MTPYQSLLQSIERSQRQQPAAPSLLTIASQDPIGVLKGGGQGILAIPKGLLDLGYNVVSKTFSEGPIAGATTLVGGLGGEQFYKQYQNEVLRSGKPKNFEDEVLTYGNAAVNFVLEDLLPGRQAKELATGKRQVGTTDLGDPIEQNLTPEQLGENITLGLIQLAPVSKLFGRGTKINLKTGLSAEAEAIAKPSLTPTVGELTNKNALKSQIDTYITAQKSPPHAAAQTSTTARIIPKGPLENLQAQYYQRYKVASQLASGDVDLIFKDLISKDVLTEMTLKLPPETRISEIGRQAILEGHLSDNVVDFLRNKYDLTDNSLAQVADDIADVLSITETEAGRTHLAASKAAADVYPRIVLEAQRGNPLAIERLKLQERMKQRIRQDNGILSVYDFALQLGNSIEAVRRTIITSPPPVALRNAFVVGGPLTISGLLENVTADIINTLSNKAKIRPDAQSRFVELNAQLHSIASSFSKQDRALAGQILDAVPLTKQRLYSQTQFDTANRAFGFIAGKKLGKQVADFLDDFTHTISYFNRTQEVNFRRMLFQNRLESNLKHLGWADDIANKKGIFNQLLEKLHEPSIPDNLRNAIADAESFALKNTFSSTPVAGLGKAVLDVYKKIPFATAILPTFPRFLYNMWSYLGERSPSNLLSYFWDPKFRDALSQGGLVGAAASRKLAKGVQGMMLLGGAYMIRTNPEWGGSKYYQVKDVLFPGLEPLGIKIPKDENNVIDIRAYQPFATYMFVADMLKTVNEGREINLTPNELADALIGTRRIAEVPAFSISDTLRSIKSTNPSTVRSAINTPLGQYVASFFVPFHSVREWVGALSSSDEPLIRRDVDRQELTGPARESLAFESLPKRIDVFTGEPIKTRREDALLRQMTGLSRSNVQPLQDIILNTPDFSPSDIIGDFGTPEATGLVTKHVGQSLTRQIGKSNVGTIISDYIKQQRLTPQAQRELLQKIFRELRDSAKQKAIAENPKAFVDYTITNEVLPSQRRPITRFIENILLHQGAFDADHQ